MNARCYDHSLCESLESVTYLNTDGNIETSKIRQEDFGYKISPFQKRKGVIVEAYFSLKEEAPVEELLEKMKNYKADRENKGHYRFPSAGSVFKNNRDFGKPSGKIIDEASLKGMRIGCAQVSPDHGNIIYNTGGATSTEIKNLIDLVKQKVQNETGFNLEEEVIYMGEW